MFLRMIGEYRPCKLQARAILFRRSVHAQVSSESQPSTGETLDIHEYVTCQGVVIKKMLYVSGVKHHL